MNPQNYLITSSLQNKIREWEHSINCYNGQDPLDLWFQYICWLESNLITNPSLEAKFRKAVEQCLSSYDQYNIYKQDLRMVKLWIKYIDFQPNPLNLYKILYQQGIGTSCAAFYIGWAHYYNSENLLKQAESIFNLGVQLKAQPIVELENAQKHFRYSVAQRTLYNDESSKKRTISSLAEQRQKITSLSPHQLQVTQPSKKVKLSSGEDLYRFNSQSIANSKNEKYSSSSSSSPLEYNYASNTLDPGYVISSSLNYVYSESHVYGSCEEQYSLQQPAANSVFDSGFQTPRYFFNFAKNSHEPWRAQLYLEESYDPNQRCFYPKHLVYAGDGEEYSLEELKALKWYSKAESRNKNGNRQEQERRQDFETKTFMEEQEKIRKKQEEDQSQIDQLSFRKGQEEVQRETYQHPQLPYQQQSSQMWNNSDQNALNYMTYYQQNYDNSNNHRYQTHYQQTYQNISPNFHNSSDYNIPPDFHHQQLVTNECETQQLTQSQNANPYYLQAVVPSHSQRYPDNNNFNNSYQTYHQATIESYPQNPIGHISSPTNVLPTNTNEVLGMQSRLPDYQDVEYLIDHQAEIDPEMLQQPIIEQTEELNDNKEDSSSEDSDEEPYNGPAPLVNSYMLNDLEEQIEASTISFSSNGKSRDKKITIKFRKEKTSTILSSESNSESSLFHRNYSATPSNKSSSDPVVISSSSTESTKSKKQIFQTEILNTFEGDNTQFMPSATNSCSSTANSDGNASFGNISFNGCVSTGKKPSNKISSSVNSYKFLKKKESLLSVQNDDSICSSSYGDQNSFFQAENDEEFKGKRIVKALTLIDDHLNKPDIDPFNSELCKAFLVKLNFPNRENVSDYKISNTNLPKLSKNHVVPLGGVNYQIEKEVGRGSYGAVYRGVNTCNGSVVALKYQKPPNSWELYICMEVKKRLENIEILPGFMSISAALIAPNASILISEFSHYGSLLDVNNRIRQATTKVMHESLVMHFSSQILNIVSHLHSCSIIHADIKPDNFLLMSLPSPETYVPSLRLIDFGCAIDMKLFPKNTEFKKMIQTDGFTCTEMLEGRPWSYQTDLFCVAGTIHVMLFGEYMQVNKKFGVWEIKQKFPRYLNKRIWSDIFSELLNIKDNQHLPDLRRMRNRINSETNDNELIRQIRSCSNLIRKR